MTTTCKSCAGPVRWVRTVAGKAMPLDQHPTPAGNMIATLDGWKVLGPGDDRTAPRYMPHWATCPNAKEHRK